MSTEPMQAPPTGPYGEQPQYQPPGAPYPSPQAASYPPPYGVPAGVQYPPPAQPGPYAPYPGAPMPPGYPVQPAGVTAPSVWPVAIITVLAGVFGVIPAAIRSNKAKAIGAPVGKYWWTFGGIMAAYFLLVIVTVAAGGAARQASVMDTQKLQQALVQDGDWKDSAGNVATPKDATCVQVSVSNTGTGSYKCMIDIADDSRESVDVTVSPDGSWVTS